MTKPIVAPYGSWKSPITSNLIVSETIEFEQIALDGQDVYWIEKRPEDGGRHVIVRWSSNGQIVDITPPPFNARTRVHEYGGGSFAVADGCVYFSNFNDQRIYRQRPGSKPQPITYEVDMRYADSIIDRRRRNIICVREDHTNVGREPVNTLVSLDLEGDNEDKVLVSGNDFYSSPRLSPDGSLLAWLTWNHPQMPWDVTELWISEVGEDGSLGRSERIAGGVGESIFQPEWSPDGILYFVSDRNGWWNLYRWRNKQIEPMIQMEAEFGLPRWLFGLSTYMFESASRIICTYTQQGIWYLASLDTKTRVLKRIEIPYNSIEYLRVATNRVVFIGGSSTESKSVVLLDLFKNELKLLRHSSEIFIDDRYLSKPLAIEFPTKQGMKANAFFYAPKNLDFMGSLGERPPLLVISHGGPTYATSGAFNLMIQYWTSRGIAVLDVNYGGSTGFGRAYRQRLDGQWGKVDVEDCMNGARYLVDCNKVDSNRLAIRGGSAGGYTALCALTHSNVFKAGASYFGVSDLEALVKETHKFESHYLDKLIGPYPECRGLYRERSPITYVKRLSCPVIFFQGLEDKIVPPNQTMRMVNELSTKGLPVAYILFKGEQHGFRRGENIKRALDAELYFYSKIFGFDLAESVEPVLIENL